MCDGRIASYPIRSRHVSKMASRGRGAGEDAAAGAFRSEVGESRVSNLQVSEWKRPRVAEMGGIFEIRGEISMQYLPIVRAIIHATTANRGVL